MSSTRNAICAAPALYTGIDLLPQVAHIRLTPNLTSGDLNEEIRSRLRHSHNLPDIRFSSHDGRRFQPQQSRKVERRIDVADRETEMFRRFIIAVPFFKWNNLAPD
jgi:hypothetical protein